MEFCIGAPPSHAVDWAIYTRDGRILFGRGQTAFVAARSASVPLSETTRMTWQVDDA